MLLAVARQEGDAFSSYLAQGEPIARRTVRRFDDDLACVLEQRIETRSAENADVRSLSGQIQLP